MKALAIFLLFNISLYPESKSDIDIRILQDKIWVYVYPEVPNENKIAYTAIERPKKNDLGGNHWMELMNRFTLDFKKDNTFIWDTHPSCGTNIGAVRGDGKWSYDAKKKVLLLDYKGTITEGFGKKGKEKYLVLKLSAERLELQRIDTDTP